MSHTLLLVQCEDLQDTLLDVQGKSSIAINDPTPFIQFLTSPANKSRLNSMVATGNGKARNINLTYAQRLLENTVSDVTERGCDATAQIGNLEKDYTIDTQKILYSGELILASDLTRVCQSNPAYIAQRLAHHLDVIDRKVATQTGVEAAAILGGWSADVSAAGYTVTADKLVVATKASGEFKVGAWEEISSATIMSGYGQTIGFGGNDLQVHMRLSDAGCCTNNGLDVFDILSKYGYAYAYDRRLAAALGSVATQSLIMEPGALQLLTYTETPWKDGVFNMGEGYISEQFTTPNGVPVDIYIKDDCGKVHINVFACTKLVALPDDMFHAGDNFEDVTFAAGITVDNS